jgi:predicted cupin superfamily sugar epimerase
MGTTMTPGFDPRDFELGRRDALITAYPQARDRIFELTRA